MDSEDDLEPSESLDDPRRVYGPGETPPELAKIILRAFDELIVQADREQE